MSNRDDWWPTAQPTSLERMLVASILFVLVPLILSAYNNLHLLGRYDRPAVAMIALAFFLLVLCPLWTRSPTPTQQALYASRSIRAFLENLGDPCDWDDFISSHLGDPDVDSVRRRAAGVCLPVSDEGKLVLTALADEADEIASANGR